MAHIRVPDENREIQDPQAIARFLAPFGIWYEKWEVEGRIDGDAGSEEILAAYDDEIQALNKKHGFITADVIDVTADTPGLDEMLNKLNKEHTHTEDEVRFIVKGRGIFHIRPENGPIFALQTDAGDLISVPAGTRHWFDLCEEQEIRAIRLFLDKSGWTPHYVEDGAHDRYAPVCWGPSYLPADATRIDPVI